MLRLRYNISPRFRHWSAMVDDKRGPVVKRAPREEDTAAGLTLPSVLLSLLGMRGALTD